MKLLTSLSDKSRRDTLSLHLKSLASIISETLEEKQRNPAATTRSLEDITVNKKLEEEEEDKGCKIYYETICTGDKGLDLFDSRCERIPVRLCAEGCQIQEGETECER